MRETEGASQAIERAFRRSGTQADDEISRRQHHYLTRHGDECFIISAYNHHAAFSLYMYRVIVQTIWSTIRNALSCWVALRQQAEC